MAEQITEQDVGKIFKIECRYSGGRIDGNYCKVFPGGWMEYQFWGEAVGRRSFMGNPFCIEVNQPHPLLYPSESKMGYTVLGRVIGITEIRLEELEQYPSCRLRFDPEEADD